MKWTGQDFSRWRGVSETGTQVLLWMYGPICGVPDERKVNA